MRRDRTRETHAKAAEVIPFARAARRLALRPRTPERRDDLHAPERWRGPTATPRRDRR